MVSWDLVCRPKEVCGLGVENISLRNQALLEKWLWRYPKESSTLWHKVILSIYETHPNGWDTNNIVRWSHHCPWKAIAHICSTFLLHTLILWQVMGLESILGKICDGGTNLCVYNFQVFSESPLLITILSQLPLVITFPCLRISHFVAI